MSLVLRLFTLALLLGWQAVAIGASGPAHYCPKQIERRSTHCRCPHGLEKAEQAPHARAMLRMDCCDEPGWRLPAPAFADVTSTPFVIVAPLALPPTWLDVRPPEGGPLPSLASWEAPRAQGPPVFLRIRTLLL
ncbi:hypothetical protein JY651_22450 [Pyxidicoccus parkwayensis]|uniref:Uncharacterized protein n=1 Tax=Pyxidicoccus parkwayensis TaxID=2813578 RepID=A0ABX7PAG5_9BACT|nr:hypothetical protein [Pyxidicoccus parkwaysis]QSQ27503.1 hypothetical protein JY651_22450 [Pyxidicoccus parkwaysis]